MVFTMHLLRQMMIFWSSFGQTVGEMCMNNTSSRAKKQPSPRLNPGPQMAEEQAGFRPGRGTIEQIDLLRLIVEKYLALQDK